MAYTECFDSAVLKATYKTIVKKRKVVEDFEELLESPDFKRLKTTQDVDNVLSNLLVVQGLLKCKRQRIEKEERVREETENFEGMSDGATKHGQWTHDEKEERDREENEDFEEADAEEEKDDEEKDDREDDDEEEEGEARKKLAELTVTAATSAATVTKEDIIKYSPIDSEVWMTDDGDTEVKEDDYNQKDMWRKEDDEIYFDVLFSATEDYNKIDSEVWMTNNGEDDYNQDKDNNDIDFDVPSSIKEDYSLDSIFTF